MIALIFQNHYERLQINPEAGPEEIKAAYRRAARIWHPDVAGHSPSSHKAFLLIREAYEILIDPRQRQDYDALIAASKRFRDRQKEAGRSGPRRARTSQGGQPARTGPDREYPGREDLTAHADLEISLEEAIRGTSQEITLEQDVENSAGKAYETFRVSVPPLVRAEQQVRVPGRGLRDPRSGERGPLVLTIRYARHPHFRPLGADLYTTVDIWPWDAALGSLVRLPTLEGDASMRLPVGSQPWQSLRIAGCGLPGTDPAGSRGDLVVGLRFRQPATANPEQARLWRQLKAAYA